MIKSFKILLFSFFAALALTACSNQKAIVAKWVSTDPADPETIEFLKDGTLIGNNAHAGPFTGSYTFPDDTHVMVKMNGLLLSLAPPAPFTISISHSVMTMTAYDGSTTKYKRAD